LGMAVIMDWVANHTSWDHAWITTHKDWYSQDSQGNIVTPNSSWQDVAQLNYENAAMRKEMISALKYWIYEANIDGYRCDAADRMPVSFWLEAIREMRNMQPGRDIIMLAEGTRLDNFTAGFDLDYGWDFMKVLKQVYDSTESTASLVNSHEAEYKNLSTGKRKLRFITNHDEAADAPLFSLYGGRNGSVSAFVAAASLGGNPLLYSSQEVGYNSRLSFFKYVEVDWSANPDLLAEYKGIMKAFAASTALRKGVLQSFSTKDVLGIYKLYERNEVIVLANARNNQRTIQVDKTHLSGNWKNAITGDAVTLTEQMELQPYQYLILTK
ncbi:MAG: alpha-amylase, partial [Bacteroides sp.]|nr:alpha-amylase [Bacteroides sp.]